MRCDGVLLLQRTIGGRGRRLTTFMDMLFARLVECRNLRAALAVGGGLRMRFHAGKSGVLA